MPCCQLHGSLSAVVWHLIAGDLDVLSSVGAGSPFFEVCMGCEVLVSSRGSVTGGSHAGSIDSWGLL